MTKPASPSGNPTTQTTRARSVFCNRTLNLRSISAIGYDMDYTLVQYHVVEWETLAYAHAKRSFAEQGWPVESLAFDPTLMTQGLIIDTELGNLLKVNSFGYVKQAFHGTRPLEFESQRRVYGHAIIDHQDPQRVFLSTLFSLSESCLFAQLVELWDTGQLPAVTSYADLHRRVRATIDEAHRAGVLKAEIAADFARFVDLDPLVTDTLLDQRGAGKKLMLVTNSDWVYTQQLMAFAFDRFLPKGKSWRDLFDIIVIAARKPDFFKGNSPFLEVIDDQGLLRPMVGKPREGGVYFGGNAAGIEELLGLSGDQILYVGDHFFGDVQVTKSWLRWRTALIVPELEADLAAEDAFAPRAEELGELMEQKTELERAHCQARLCVQRIRAGRPVKDGQSEEAIRPELDRLRTALELLDERIAPLAKASAIVGNANWGVLMRSGNDKSYLAHLVERHADIYTSRVSNLSHETPYAYFRSARGSLPHDQG